MRQLDTLAGFSRIAITPLLERYDAFGLGYWFERHVRFTGVRDPLYVRTLALGDDATCQLIISVDAIFDSFGFGPDAADRITRRLGIPKERIFITCTHTHSAPIMDRNITPEDGAAYGSFVAGRIAESALAAFEGRERMGITLSSRKLADTLYNRRPLLKNGHIGELHVPLDPSEIADPGPINDTLTVLKFRDLQGKLGGAICHFGIHGVCIQCSHLISSDCMGRAIQRIEAETNDHARILHLNGPCGDIDPVAMGNVAALDNMTDRLLAGIRAVIAAKERPIFATPQHVIPGAFRARRRTTRSLEMLCEEERSINKNPWPGELSHHSGAGYTRFLLEEERALARMPAEFEIPYQVLRAGDLICVGIGGEVFTSFGLRLVALSSSMVILPVGITGEWKGYLPSEQAFLQGGYEVARAQWCPIASGETEKLFAQIDRDVRVAMGPGCE